MKAVWFALAGLATTAAAVFGWFAYERAQTSDPAQIEAKAPEAAKPAPATPEPAKDAPKDAETAKPAEPAKTEPETTAKPDSTPAEADTAKAETDTAAEPDAKTAEKETQPAQPAPEPVAPTFDVVRVEPDGSTVIAGRAAPGWKVRVEAQGQTVGEAVANARGEWVIIADKPLPTGSTNLSLMAASPDGTQESTSPQRVAIARPKEMKVAAADQPAGESAPSGDTADSVKPAPETGETPPADGNGKPEATKAEATPDTAPGTDTTASDIPKPPLGAKPELPEELKTKMASAAQDDAPAEPGKAATADAPSNSSSVAKDEPAAAGTEPATGSEPAKTTEPSADARVETAEAPAQPSDGAKSEPAASTGDAPASTPPAEAGTEADKQSGQQTAEPARAEPQAPLVVVSEKGKASRVLQAPSPAKPAPSLTFQSVDYDDKGRVILSGKSDAGKTLRVYLNNSFIGETTADRDGAWSLSAERDIKPGRYTLRVDQIGDGKTVLARVEAPFERAEPAAAREARENGEVVIQPGDNLWNLSRAYYGEGTQYTVIYEANKNKIRNPNLIYPGQVFTTPKVNPDELADEREKLRQLMLRYERH